MGAGYTRQSAAEIQTGEIVEAAPLNAEFNQIQSAFSGTIGHSHDGTVGEGPKVSLTSSVTGVLPVANGGTGGINKLNASAPPTINDDSADGYSVGSLWIDTTNDIAYICVDATSGAAIWVRYQPYDAGLNSIAGLTTAANKMIYTTGSDTYAVTDLTAFIRTLLDDGDAATALSTLGVSAFVQTLLDDVNVSTFLSTLGFSTYIKTLIDDADAATARTTLGLGTASTQDSNNVNITGGSITGITDLAIADGGTGASNAASARTNLGVAIGTDVQAADSTLTALAGYNTNGILTQTAADTFAGRTLTGTAGEITVTNGNGVSGNPTLSLPSTLTLTGKSLDDATFVDDISLLSTDAGATVGPLFDIYRNSASPAAADVLGQLVFAGKDSGGNKTSYALINTILADATDGSEDGTLIFSTMVAGAQTTRLSLGATNTVTGNTTISGTLTVTG